MNRYWEKLLERRIARRRAIGVTSATALGAAFLAACGGDDAAPSPTAGAIGATSSTGGPTSGAGDLVTPIEDTSATARRGGSLKWYTNGTDPVNLDFHIGQGGTKNLVLAMVNSSLLNYEAGIASPPLYERMVPDIAESWEWSGDLLQLTLKIRNDVKWHNKAPVNGRTLDAEDILFSWERWKQIGTQRSLLVNEISPNAPVLSMEAPDTNTIVFKLKDPTNYLLASLSALASGHFFIVPREAGDEYDAQREVIGSGPFILDRYDPGIAMHYVRHPEYHDAHRPYLDAVEIPFLTEYAQMLAQFKAGAIHTSSAGSVFPPGGNITREDVLLVKREQPELLVYVMDQFGFHTTNTCAFGWQPGGESPFRDKRVRQALSLSYDRDLFIETFENVSRLEAAGIPLQTAWSTALGPAPGWKLDPRDSTFGPNARYYMHDIEEAKQLLTAAGYPDGLDVISHTTPTLPGSPSFQETVEVRNQMAVEAGFRVETRIIDTPTVPDNFLDGSYEGWHYRSGRQGAEDAVSWLEFRYSTTGGTGFLGFDVNGRGDGSGDPEVDAMIRRARGQLNSDERRETIFELERYLAEQMYTVNHPGLASNVQMAWPALKNFLAFNGDRRGFVFDWWLDE